MGTNDSIWYQAQIYTTDFISRYTLYIFLIFFKYVFSLIFLLFAIIYFFFFKISNLHPIFWDLPELFYKTLFGDKKAIIEAGNVFGHKLLNICMNLYGQTDFTETVKTNPTHINYIEKCNEI